MLILKGWHIGIYRGNAWESVAVSLVLAAVVARGGWRPAQLGLARSAYTDRIVH